MLRPSRCCAPQRGETRHALSQWPNTMSPDAPPSRHDPALGAAAGDLHETGPLLAAAQQRYDRGATAYLCGIPITTIASRLQGLWHTVYKAVAQTRGRG